MTKEELIKDLKERCGEFRTQKNFCKHYNIGYSGFKKVINGENSITNKMMEKLGYIKIVSYERLPGYDLSK